MCETCAPQQFWFSRKLVLSRRCPTCRRSLPPTRRHDSATRGPHVGSTSEACDKVEEVGNTSEVEEVGNTSEVEEVGGTQVGEVGNTSEVEEVGGTQVGEVASPIEDSPELEHCRQLTMAANDDKDGNDGNDDNDDADIDSNDEGDEAVTLSKIQQRIAAWLEIIPNHKHTRTLLVDIDRFIHNIRKSMLQGRKGARDHTESRSHRFDCA